MFFFKPEKKRGLVNDKNRSHYDLKVILPILDDLHERVHAKRTWVLSCWFKEDGKRYNGLRAYGTWDGDIELLANDMPSHMHRYQNLPISVLWREWKELELSGNNFVEDIEEYDGPLDTVIHASRLARSYYAVGLFNGQNVIGVMGCDWNDPEQFTYTNCMIIEKAAKDVNGGIRTEDFWND